MRYYETLYIVNPNFEQDRLGKIKEEVSAEVSKGKATIINHRFWGKKRLAYPIQKHKYGTYILLQFEAEELSGLREFDTYMKLNRSILRHQTIRLDERPEVVEEEELATTKTGTTKETAEAAPVEETTAPESDGEETEAEADQDSGDVVETSAADTEETVTAAGEETKE
ncbi:MAG: 30S ribosomal protein S6 [Fidelibacterota bacterium]